jgi:hypothetical protein
VNGPAQGLAAGKNEVRMVRKWPIAFSGFTGEKPMADDYQSTLRGKIKILYQLEKWLDVVKLCEQYNEKYGKDVEVDMMRFKSERRLNKSAPTEENKAKAPSPEKPPPDNFKAPTAPEVKAEEEPPLLLTEDHKVVQNQAILIKNESSAADQPLLLDEKMDEEPFPQTRELVVTDPFAEDKPVPDHIAYEPYPDVNELIITDPFEENEPVFSLASNESPVTLPESGKAGNAQVQSEIKDEEMAIMEDGPNESVDTKIAFDFKNNPTMAFDAEPTLAPEPKAEKVAMQSDQAQEMSLLQSQPPGSVIIDKSAEVWQRDAAVALEEVTDEKPLPLSEPADKYVIQPKSPKKTFFNFKYLLVLIMPLAAAGILWLALSGKLTLGGNGAEKDAPGPAAEPRQPAVRRPARKVTPAVPISQIDENDKLVNEKISQANDFIKRGDFLKALAVVLEAKKIKATEPLRQLEELITKKIREDESRAAEQKQAVQVIAQSEEQSFAKADAENTVAAWQNFILLYPQGTSAARASNKIAALQKKAAQQAEQEFQQKIQQAQKLNRRSDYVSLNQAELNVALQQLGKPIVQFEATEHGGEKVIIDFYSGLMWTLWKKPMDFSKAKWWANRIYAGYSGWRLPTIDESQSLLQMDKTLYADLADFAVWTGDGVSDLPRSVWVLKLPQGQFIAQDYFQVYYVWAVRRAGK